MEQIIVISTLDLQSRFRQIGMALEDIHKSTLITKFGLFDRIVMPLGMKNATNAFSITMGSWHIEVVSKVAHVESIILLLNNN